MSGRSKLRVAMIAPPWLALPIKGYGGIELVIQGIVDGLVERGVDVTLFANGAHKIRGVKTHSLYKTEQFENIHRPYYEVMPVLQSHMQFAFNKILEDGKFDIIHDHNPLVGPVLLSMATKLKGMPPALHTFHGPPFSSKESIASGVPDNRKPLEQMTDMGKMYMTCISEAMAKTVPSNIKPHILPAVHNAIEVDQFPLVKEKKNYFITLARFTPDKAQHVAIKLCLRMKARLRMAGTVSGISSNRKLLFELSNPLSPYRTSTEFKYYRNKIQPKVLRSRLISYSGNLSGEKKMKFLSEAKALLFPIDWEEPFGMAVIEALACGTPVVAMKRGAMPEIIEHGKTGFLAKNEEEFYEYMQRVDEIDPEDCRRSVEEKFSASAMAEQYLDRYKEVIKLAKKKR